ncbi:Scr1 family TA system antitoxin-like transcriptional regulator, partial [Streptomyces sp. NPDC058614]|uniref:Scr1 family TA system antitoxin-like transcriptional regulator n=1 Tax=Streptomyces sp. NPDC058614 TaxID=3346557 RepID=UPI0036462CA3
FDGKTYFVRHEAVRLPLVGGPIVLRRQHGRLAELAAHPRRQIMIFPFSGGTAAAQGPFTIFEFEDGLQPFVYLENLRTPADISTAAEDFVKHLEVFWELEERSIKGGKVPTILLQMAEDIDDGPHDPPPATPAPQES